MKEKNLMSMYKLFDFQFDIGDSAIADGSFEKSACFSSSAGEILKEIEIYKNSLDSTGRILLEITDKFYDKEFKVTSDALKRISDNFQVDCIFNNFNIQYFHLET